MPRRLYRLASRAMPNGARIRTSQFVRKLLLTDAGAFVLSGVAATLRIGIGLTAGAGSFLATGQAATLRTAKQLVAGAGSLTLSGSDATLRKGKNLVAGGGSLALSGANATLTRAMRVAANAGGISLAGGDADLRKGRQISAEAGSLALGGQNATLLLARKMVAAAGSVALTGAAAGLAKSRQMIADAGALALTGAAATLAHILGNDAFTTVLLHFDGSDGSTTITDSNAGGAAKTWTVQGTAQLDTAIAKFGTAALLLDGDSDYITTDDHADFDVGSGEFTLDGWFNVGGGNGSYRAIFAQCDSGAGTSSFSFAVRMTDGNVMQAFVAESTTLTTVTATTAITTAGWHHFAFVRSGNTLKLFIDGVQEGGDGAFTGTVNNSSEDPTFGRLGTLNGQYWFGSLDEIRLSKGVARWTSNFTPPTAAYGP